MMRPTSFYMCQLGHMTAELPYGHPAVCRASCRYGHFSHACRNILVEFTIEDYHIVVALSSLAGISAAADYMWSRYPEHDDYLRMLSQATHHYFLHSAGIDSMLPNHYPVTNAMADILRKRYALASKQRSGGAV